MQTNEAVIGHGPSHSLSYFFSISYCLSLSIGFVASLYLFVPKNVRRLHRDNERHVKWRMASSLIFTIGSMVSCEILIMNTKVWNRECRLDSVDFTPLWHTMILYIGPIVNSICRYQFISKQNNGSFSQRKFSISFNQLDRWLACRNFLVAPLTEELIYRGCIVKALLRTKFSRNAVVWLSPLFFGSSHIHHVYRLVTHEKYPVALAWKIAAFQLIYTTLFGAYASFCYIRTGSLTGVVLSHSFCNFMGLPSISHMNKNVETYRFRNIINVAYLIGILLFVLTFDAKWKLFISRDVLLDFINNYQYEYNI